MVFTLREKAITFAFDFKEEEMCKIKVIITIILFAVCCMNTSAQELYGRLIDSNTKEGVPFATIVVEGQALWCSSNSDGYYTFKGLPSADFTITIHSLGYTSRSLRIDSLSGRREYNVLLEPRSLSIDVVTVVADNNSKSSASTYKVGREAIENLQIASLTDVMSLLPGGKFEGDMSLLSGNSEFTVRGNGGSTGASSFGTAVEIDGVRLSTNANATDISGSDLRGISVANIESVEIISGVPSAEYGDLNNGLVKINTFKGATPFIVETSLRPHTQRYGVSKGFTFEKGVLNTSFERALSVGNISHPYTTYDRNGLTLNYTHRTQTADGNPIALTFGVSGNLGGYNSTDDPDQANDNYSKQSNHDVRANFKFDYSPNLSWLTRLTWLTTASYSSAQSEVNEIYSSVNSSVAMHSIKDGYYVASVYDGGSSDAVLRLGGYWYDLEKYDNRPLNITSKLKGEWSKDFSNEISSNFMVGVDYNYTKNFGRGNYYEDLSVAPTWREYRLDELPAMHNFSLFAEENLEYATSENSTLRLMAGLRYDMTHIYDSSYGLTTALSPRLNLSYGMMEGESGNLSDIRLYASWGQASKLPSFLILNPRASYYDINTFVAASDAQNTSYQAYLTQVSEPIYNSDLEWQQTTMWEIGAKANVFGADVSISGYRSYTENNYTLNYTYSPFSYNYTGPSALEGISIPSANRSYYVDPVTGIVTVSDITGAQQSVVLDAKTLNKFRASAQYINAAPVERYGVEWIIDFPRIEALRTNFRIDGNYFVYKTLNEHLTQGSLGTLQTGYDGEPYKYIGHYIGGASVANGSIEKGLNLNLTLTTHIPKSRLIISLRFESTLMDYRQSLSEYSGGNRSYALSEIGGYISSDTDIYKGNTYVITYPEYYSTWSDPDTLIPFYDKFIWAQQNDPALFADLSKLVERSNFAYTFNPLTISAYYSVNLSVTKEIGDIASVSFYATNFFNNLQNVTSSWGDVFSGSIYGSGYIPNFYYGLSLRLKL